MTGTVVPANSPLDADQFDNVVRSFVDRWKQTYMRLLLRDDGLPPELFADHDETLLLVALGLTAEQKSFRLPPDKAAFVEACRHVL